MGPPMTVVMLLILWFSVTCIGLALSEFIYRIIKRITEGHW